MADLYKLSFKIRSPASRRTSLKAMLHKEIDKSTGIDLFSMYSEFDRRHVEESLKSLRNNPVMSQEDQHQDDDKFLIERLSKAITNRRRYFAYWRTHALKLASEVPSEKTKPTVLSIGLGNGSNAAGLAPEPKAHVQLNPALSSTERMILSATEATKYDQKSDGEVDAQSTISYATTAYDSDGNAIDLPQPPSAAALQSEFICPYCNVVCPSRHGKGKSWR